MIYKYYRCSGLTSVTIPNSVTEIGSYAFFRCDGLKEVHISDLAAWCKITFHRHVYDQLYSNPLIYAHNLYLNGKLIADLVIPNLVTSIGEGAFKDCSGLTSVTIPSSVNTIGADTFNGCSGLKEVHISDLAAWCKILFSYCNSNPLYYANNLYLNNELITNLKIPNSVTSIGAYAFCGCSGLTSVTIPNSVTSIGYYAFENCSGITKITIPKTVEIIYSGAFACNDELEVYVEWDRDNSADKLLCIAQQPFSDNIMQYGTLYVPTGTKALYEQCDPWRNFFNIEEYTPSGIEEIEAEGGVTIGVEGGKIVVAGAGDAKVEVFGTNGAAVYIGSADNLPELAAGIYIVRIGSTVKKVAIAQ